MPSIGGHSLPQRCRSLHAAPLRRTGREGAAADIGAHPKRAREARQSDQRQLSGSSWAGRSDQTADRFAETVMPIIASLQKSGITSLRGVAIALNARGIRTARGCDWQVSPSLH
jgi:hypothetical protein